VDVGCSSWEQDVGATGRGVALGKRACRVSAAQTRMNERPSNEVSVATLTRLHFERMLLKRAEVNGRHEGRKADEGRP